LLTWSLPLLKRLILFACSAGVFCWTAWLAARPPVEAANGVPQLVRPGVVHRLIVRRAGPWRIHVLEIDLRRQELEIGTARALDRYYGREPVSSIAARKSDEARVVVAGLNGDYFIPATGEVQNNQIADGVYVKAFASPGLRPEYVDIPNSQFALTADGRPSIDQYIFDGSVSNRDGSRAPLAGVNIIPRRGGLTIFNGYFGESSPVAGEADSALHLPLILIAQQGDTLVTLSAGPALSSGGIPLSKNRFALAAYRLPALRVLRGRERGDTILVVLSLRPHRGQITQLIGGWPRLVRDGKSVFATAGFPENPGAPLFAKRHPRTGIGFSRDGKTLYFVTVDGRQETSAGMSLPEFANLMVSLGIAQGLNLDGGGSTTMLINDGVVNSPSDPTGERPVGNCLLLYSRLRPHTAERH
jgi:exopolysaccharide biosynthesis protein